MAKAQTDNTTMPTIKLQSSDDKIFVVDVQVACCSKEIKTMLDDLGALDLGHEEIIPLSNVNADILAKIIEWGTHHKNDIEPAMNVGAMAGNPDICFDDWDADFLQVDWKTLEKLCYAAHCLNIQGLFDLTCKAIAKMLNGKTAEEMREIFGIQNEFTAEEEESIRKENEWVLRASE